MTRSIELIVNASGWRFGALAGSCPLREGSQRPSPPESGLFIWNCDVYLGALAIGSFHNRALYTCPVALLTHIVTRYSEV